MLLSFEYLTLFFYNNRYYTGKITRARSNDTYDILYDDGEKELGVKPNLIKLQESSRSSSRRDDTEDEGGSFEVGDKVEAKYRGRNEWLEGEVTKVRPGDLYDISYEDEKFESRVTSDKLRKTRGSRRSPKKGSSRLDRGDSDDDDVFESVDSPRGGVKDR